MKKAPLIVAIVSLCACAVAVMAALGGWNAAEELKTGSVEGFEATGMYRAIPDAEISENTSLALLEDEEDPDADSGTFQLVFHDPETVINGTFERTADRNIIVLTSDDGGEIGMIRLAYSTGPKDGALTAMIGTKKIDFTKMEGRPAFVVSQE